MGVIIAHLTEALPINKFRNAKIIINFMRKGIGSNPEYFRNIAPSTATICPDFVQLKKTTNYSAKKTSSTLLFSSLSAD